MAWALGNKGEGHVECGHAEEALHTCEELERRLDALSGMEKPGSSGRYGVCGRRRS